MVDFTLGSISSYLGLVLLWIVVIWNYLDERKRKKEGTFKYIEKDPRWKQTYIWQVFFRRSFYRPCASTFPYLIFIFPATLMILIHSVGLFHGYPQKLEEMKKVSGIVTKVHIGKGKNSYDYITIKDDKENEGKYRVSSIYFSKEVNEFIEKTQNLKVDIEYQDKWFLRSYKDLKQLKVNGKFLTLGRDIRFKYDYKRNVEFYNSHIPSILWWTNYSLVGWLWIWLLNKKELPIHRLNRKKFYKKNRLKDEK